MSPPHLPKVPPAARRHGPARLGSVRPRLLLRGLLVGGALLLLAVLLASCGNAALPAAPPTPAPTTAPGTPQAPTTAPSPAGSPEPTAPSGQPGRDSAGGSGGGPDGRSGSTSGEEPGGPARTGADDGRPGGNAAPAPDAQPARPHWPATDAASAQDLQAQADGGGDPWLLDPEEVAISYAGSELGYRNPEVVVLAPGRVDLKDGRSPAQALVTLEQTVRSGPGGIWLVTDVDRR